MAKIRYTDQSFSLEKLTMIQKADDIIAEYDQQGYTLTLRQLYYQFVARDIIPNTERSYKMLGTLISDARRAGMIDWSAIVDRTRHIRRPSQWNSPADMVESCADQFNIDRWDGQRYRPEVWIEKDALVGVLQVACAKWFIPYFSCRGYVSDSEVWSSGQRFASIIQGGQTPIVFHLGDHDPSGIDMTRDIEERLSLFADAEIEVRRIALTMDQIDTYSPPPNPAKSTDTRFKSYQEAYGDESWELDALDPETITDLIAHHIGPLVNGKLWEKKANEVKAGQKSLQTVATQWEAAHDAATAAQPKRKKRT